MPEIRDSDLHRIIDDWQDRHPEPGPDEDSLRNYLTGGLHADWSAQRAHSLGYLVGYGAVVLLVAVTVLAVMWSVTA